MPLLTFKRAEMYLIVSLFLSKQLCTWRFLNVLKKLNKILCDLDNLLLSEGFLLRLPLRLHLHLHLLQYKSHNAQIGFLCKKKTSSKDKKWRHLWLFICTHKHVQYLEVSKIWLQVRFQHPRHKELQHRTEGKDTLIQLKSCRENRGTLPL